MKNTLMNLIGFIILAFGISNAHAAFIESKSGSASSLSVYYPNDNEVSFSAGFDKSGGNAFFTFTDTFTTAGTFSFDWFFLDQSSGQSKLGYLLNNNEYDLLAGTSINHGGPISVSIAAGDSFGWFFNYEARSQGYVVGRFENISFVTSPSAVPEPNVAYLLFAGLLSVGALRKKMKV